MTRQDHGDDQSAGGESTRPALQFDPARYAAELEGYDLTEAQRQELLLILWSIMQSFVELGFTVDVCTALLDDTSTVPFGVELD